MNRSIQAFAFAIILLGLTATHARADLNIALGNDLNLAPGGIGTIDITVTSNNNDTLSAFGLELLITLGTPTPTSLLTFTGGIDPSYSSSSYVFFGQSSNSDYGSPFWGAPYQSSPVTGYASDSISGGDSADPLAGPGYVSITSTPLLLATVQFQAAPGATPGDTFQISLVPTNPLLTYFQYDQNPDHLLNYTSAPGTVTIASAVPEPSSLTIVALSGLSGLLLCYVRGRKHGLLKNSPTATSISIR